MTDQDQDWFDLIAGRDVETIEPRTRQEVEALRQTILQHHQIELKQNQSTHDEVAHARGLKQLLKQLEQKDLLKKTKQNHTKPSQLRKYSSIAAAVLVFLSVLVITPFQDPLLPQTSTGFTEPPTLRSGMNTQTISVKDQKSSHKISQQLIQQLIELKIPYQLTSISEKESWQLEIEIPFEPSDNILTFLKQWHLKETENGWIKLVPEITSQ